LRRTIRHAAVLALSLLAGAEVRGADAPKPPLLGPDPVAAFRAVEAAEATRDVANAAMLLEAGWKTAYPHIAVACGDALAAIGAPAVKDSAYQRVLTQALKDKDPQGLVNLARVLGAFGDPSVDEPLAALAAGRRTLEVQVEALYMIGGLPVSPATPFPRCVAAVGAAIKATRPEAQMAAASAAGRLKDPSYKDALGEVARRSQHAYAGLYAVRALARMGEKGPLSSFLNVLDSNPKRETMQSCLKAVVDLTGPEDTDALLALTRSPQKDYRDAACLAFLNVTVKGGFPGPAVTPKEGESPQPTTAPPSKVVDRMLQLIESDPAWEVRDAASRVVQAFGTGAREQVVAKIPALVDASDRDVGLTATELSGVFRLQESWKELLKTATLDKDPARRMYAARAAGLVNPQLAAEEWLEAVSRDRKGKDTTLNTIRALGYVRHEAAYQGLVAILGGTGWSEKILAETERSLERLTARRFGRKPERWNAWYASAKDLDPFRPHIGRFDRLKNRREAVSKRLYGLTDTTERSVETGLRWLEKQQKGAGYWDGNEKNFGGVINCEPAYTALALLAYLGAGYESEHHKFRETVRRATEFLASTQFYDGGFPVTGGSDNSWIFAYLIGMAIWGMTESWALSGDATLDMPVERGIGYLVRVQTPGAGWRYGPRYSQSDTSCTSWVLMTLKAAAQLGLHIPEKAYDGIDSWLERCGLDITGEEELPEDMKTDYDKEVGAKRYFKAFTGYFTLSGSEASSLQQTSMTAVGMVCRFFMGWQRSHPFMIGSANYLMDFLPQWRKGLEKGQAIAWYFYYYYYGTLAMHQMGGRYWRAWNEKIKTVLPANQRTEPPELAGSWDPDSAVLNGGRLFSTSMGILTLETYYRFSPLMLSTEEDDARRREAAKHKPAGGDPAMGDAAMGDAAMGDAAMGDAAMGDGGMDGAGMDGGAMDGDGAMDGAGMGG
jgi:HEAT repeat protein